MNELFTAEPYRSKSGWSLCVPKHWRVVIDTPTQMVALNNNDDKLCFNWICTSPISSDAAIDFKTLTLSPGPVFAEEAYAVMQPIFPILGMLTQAAVEERADGSTALIVENSFIDETSRTLWKGFSFITPVFGDPMAESKLQRLAFFAERREYDRHISEVRSAIRSFAPESQAGRIHRPVIG